MTSLSDIDLSAIPTHVAIIMDGNGRWAKERGEPRHVGHTAGEAALFDVIEGALAVGLPWMTIYAFSTENWKRPLAEVKFIMNFNRDLLKRRGDELHERNVRVRFIGRRVFPIPRGLIAIMNDIEARTRDNTGMTLQIAFNYGGRAEIVDALQAIVAKVANGELDPSKVRERTLKDHLYAPDAPDVDLLVRSSGEHRTSNFLIWQAAYAELVFDDTLWPDWRREHLWHALSVFQQRSRRFGGLNG
ncbi:polyprenyl diphosphate synthase [Stomatohabitans albus]|uniref:polyprenyl diphosphate synthase n=1 Tax=Stomatohabitans albus TaxID=3110766 RepID=UPI00300CD788